MLRCWQRQDPRGWDRQSTCFPGSWLLNVSTSGGCAKRKNMKDQREEKMLSLGRMLRGICRIVTEPPSLCKAARGGGKRTKQIPERYRFLCNAILQLPTELAFQSLIISVNSFTNVLLNFISLFFSFFFWRKTNTILGALNIIIQDEPRWFCNGLFCWLESMSAAQPSIRKICSCQYHFLGHAWVHGWGVAPPWPSIPATHHFPGILS